MSSDGLRGRKNWQTLGGGKAGAAEKGFFDVFSEAFQGTDFTIRPKPNEFRNIYTAVKLHQTTLDGIYCPDREWVHGVKPDYAIGNTKTKKTLYVEVKRQDGWVEGKLAKDGRGNAHERSCKFFTPGLLKTLRSHGNLGDAILPFWVVFQGDIARDPKRVREVTLWYEGCEDHFFMWGDSKNAATLLKHFNDKLRHYLL